MSSTPACPKPAYRYINKNDLQEQMKIKEEKSKIEYENFLKEKLMIDEIVRKIHDEDQR